MTGNDKYEYESPTRGRRMWGKKMENISEKIQKLKEEKNAVILAHYYQDLEVQKIADYVGDSFGLAKKAMETDKDIIVFCGVHFMAESAKILNPERKVLIPVVEAGCAMADMVTQEDVKELRKKYPEAAAVCYVNSSAAVKAECDISCTSSNAVEVVASLPQRQIIFVPDENLASFVAAKIPEKEFVPFTGFCPVHHQMTTEEVIEAKAQHPDAPVLVHPECPAAVVALSDFAGSTKQIIDYTLKSDKKEFIIGTEKGVIDYLYYIEPTKEYHLMSQRLVCRDMKKTTLEDVLSVLEKEDHEIQLPEEQRKASWQCLARMMEIGEKK